MGIQTSLDAIRGAERLVDSMRLADDLAFDASRDGGARTIRLLTAAIAGDDHIVAIAATHALAQIVDHEADAALTRLLSDRRPYLREHAAWALGTRLPRFDGVGRLIGLAVTGGFAGMLAQRTLERWCASGAIPIAIGIESALLGTAEPSARFRLVETIGLVADPIARGPLLRTATDAGEGEDVRVAAIAALGERRGDPEISDVLEELARTDGKIGSAAKLACVDLSVSPSAQTATLGGLTMAQLFLHADIDPELSQSGSGDNGGIATLLVHLGDALTAGESARSSGVRRVLTLSRGPVAKALESVVDVAASESGHVYGTIPLPGPSVQSASAWPLRVAARRGLRRLLRAAGRVDVLHLRMADVGSLAAADVARELDIPVVFSLAPDPHALINSLDLSHRLTRSNFGDLDAEEHFWFRARLVQELATNAAHTVLFPRPELQHDMRKLVGIDITAHPERHTITPEGIDVGVTDRAVAEAAAYAAGGPPTDALASLAALLKGLPPERRELPLLVSVGRFHRVKGMATIVQAWANELTGSEGTPLRDRANLLLIGGDLTTPSPDEREQLDLIDALVPESDRVRTGLLLPGHLPNDTVARWVAAARFGVPQLAAGRGVYVCGSLKEEFGIALLEAMASGLIVVAPNGGGPATYVEQGVTGVLTTTWDAPQLARAIDEALALAGSETTDDRASRSRATVADSFTIEAVAEVLSGLYERVHREESELRSSLTFG